LCSLFISHSHSFLLSLSLSLSLYKYMSISISLSGVNFSFVHFVSLCAGCSSDLNWQSHPMTLLILCTHRTPSLSQYYEFSKDQDYICSTPNDSGMHLCGNFPPYRIGSLVCNGKFPSPSPSPPIPITIPIPISIPISSQRQLH